MAEHIQTPYAAVSIGMGPDLFAQRSAHLDRQGYQLDLICQHPPASADDGLQLIGATWVMRRDGLTRHPRVALDHDEYQAAFEAYLGLGCVPQSVGAALGPRVANVRTPATLAGIWREGVYAGLAARHGLSHAGYQEAFEDNAERGRWPVQVVGYSDGTSSRYAALFSSHVGRPRARHGMSESEFHDADAEAVSDGLTLDWLNVHSVDGSARFTALWRSRPGIEIRVHVGLSRKAFRERCGEALGDYWEVRSVCGYLSGSRERFAVLLHRGPIQVSTSGRGGPALRAFDHAVRGDMAKHGISVAQCAVARNGHLIYAKAFNRGTAHMPRFGPTALLRIASNSKTLTAVAIATLYDRGLLRPDDRVTDILPLAEPPEDPRVHDIEVSHLVFHMSGLDPTASSVDSMKRDRDVAAELGALMPITAAQRITHGLRSPLASRPGEEARYSNLGYLMLGQIIEAVTGQPYAEYVREAVLAPLGITRPRPARAHYEDRAPGEAVYMHDAVNAIGVSHRVGGTDIESKQMMHYGGIRVHEGITPAGGWLASAVDLVRFACAFDDPMECPILSPLYARFLFIPNADANVRREEQYAMGWTKADGFWYRGGTMEGTKAYLERRVDEASGDVFNTSVIYNRYGTAAMSEWDPGQAIRDALDKVRRWPKRGSWSEFLAE